MKKYVSPEQIERARQMDLLTFLRLHEPNELIRLSADVYTTRTHDTLKISNGAWMWWSRGFGGYSALDYLVKVKEMDFVEAVELIIGERARLPPEPFNQQNEKKPKEKKPLLLPEKSSTNFAVIQYLCSRGIDKRIVEECIQQGLIYESLPYHNAIFVGYDSDNNPRYAAYRSTRPERYLGDCSGSDKNYSFRLVGAQSDSLHLFESAIDLLSYATLLKYNRRDYRQTNMISLAGIYAPSKKTGKEKAPIVLLNYLSDHPETKTIIIHFDNDDKGRAATQVIMNKLSDQYNVVDYPPKFGKDFNDYLCLLRQNQLTLRAQQGR